MKKQFVKALVLILALVLCLSLPLSVSAATTADATIDPNAMCSLSIYKYDFTNAVRPRSARRNGRSSTIPFSTRTRSSTW